LIDWVTVQTHFVHGHNAELRVRTIVNAMPLFMLRAPTLVRTGANFVMLEEAVESTEETCTWLVGFINHADALPQDQLPLEVSLVFFGESVHVHQDGIVGSFEHVQQVNNAGAVLILYGRDVHGAQIIDLVATPPLPLPVPPVPPAQAGQPLHQDVHHKQIQTC